MIGQISMNCRRLSRLDVAAPPLVREFRYRNIFCYSVKEEPAESIGLRQQYISWAAYIDIGLTCVFFGSLRFGSREVAEELS